jgi:hypothetical protein
MAAFTQSVGSLVAKAAARKARSGAATRAQNRVLLSPRLLRAAQSAVNTKVVAAKAAPKKAAAKAESQWCAAARRARARAAAAGAAEPWVHHASPGHIVRTAPCASPRRTLTRAAHPGTARTAPATWAPTPARRRPT